MYEKQFLLPPYKIITSKRFTLYVGTLQKVVVIIEKYGKLKITNHYASKIAITALCLVKNKFVHYFIEAPVFRNNDPD